MSYELKKYILQTQDEAVMVLDDLKEKAETYGTISVADYYESMGFIAGLNDHGYGWNCSVMDKVKIRPVTSKVLKKGYHDRKSIKQGVVEVVVGYEIIFPRLEMFQ